MRICDMDKSTFYATYQRECYIKGYGRKFYRKGVKLNDIKDSKGNIIAEQMTVALSKAFSNADLNSGDRIEFKAVLTDNNWLMYISNIKRV